MTEKIKSRRGFRVIDSVVILALFAIVLMLGLVFFSMRGKDGVWWQQDSSGNFVLYVSNQSKDFPDVDIKVFIDGKPAIDNSFNIGDCHNWFEFTYKLPFGEHRVKVVSENSGATLTQPFTVTGKHWGIIDFWHNAKSKYGPGTPKRFTFDIMDEQPLFD